jgi:6-phosphogluconolactonase
VGQVLKAAEAAIDEKGAFTLALSGGSLLKALALFSPAKVDFSSWWIFFVDERNVSHSSDDSTFKGAKEAFLSKVGIPESQILEIHEGFSAAEAAINYEGRMLDVPSSVLPRDAEGFPIIDCMLLGTGPDGHIASLFPNSSELAQKEGWILPVTNSPKPPPARISMTLPVINAAKQCIFLATGSGKAEVVHRVLECQALPGALPAQLVRPKNGTVTWLLDLESSAQLEIADWDNKKSYPRSQV